MAVLVKAMKMPKFKKCFKITCRLQKPGKIRDHYKMEIWDGLWFFQYNHYIVYSSYFPVPFIIIAVSCLWRDVWYLAKISKGPRRSFLQTLQVLVTGFSNNCICYKRRHSHLNLLEVVWKVSGTLNWWKKAALWGSCIGWILIYRTDLGSSWRLLFIMWPWPNDLVSLSLSFLLHKNIIVGII